MKAFCTLLVLLSGCARYQNWHEDKQAREARAYPVADVLKQASENIVKADIDWKERFGRFSGTVAEVGITKIRTKEGGSVCTSVYWSTYCNQYPPREEKRSYVSMVDPSAKAVFVCLFRDSKYGEAAKLTQGQPATVAGHILSITKTDDGTAVVTAIRCSLPGDPEIAAQ
jgi:hypothetical protein